MGVGSNPTSDNNFLTFSSYFSISLAVFVLRSSCICGNAPLMVYAGRDVCFQNLLASRPATSSVRCIDGVCWWGRVFSKHSSGSIHQCFGAKWANCNLQWEPGSQYRLKRGKLEFENKTFLIDNCAI